MTQSPYVLAGPNSLPPAPWTFWVVEGQLLAGCYPGSADPLEHRSKIDAVLAGGVDTFINLMEDSESRRFAPYQPVARELADEQLRFLQFPIRDVSVPTPDLTVSILDAIDGSLHEGRIAYVHCWGGVGRTGIVIGCWLLRHSLATSDDVLATLARLRKQDTVRGHREAPETEEQRRFVRE